MFKRIIKVALKRFFSLIIMFDQRYTETDPNANLEFNDDHNLIAKTFLEMKIEILPRYIDYISQLVSWERFQDIRSLVISRLGFNPELDHDKVAWLKCRNPELFSEMKKIIDDILEDVYSRKESPEVMAFLCLAYQAFLIQKIEHAINPFQHSVLSPFVYAMQ